MLQSSAVIRVKSKQHAWSASRSDTRLSARGSDNYDADGSNCSLATMLRSGIVPSSLLGPHRGVPRSQLSP